MSIPYTKHQMKSTIIKIIALSEIIIWVFIQPLSRHNLMEAKPLGDAQSSMSLRVGEPVERKLEGGQKHDYDLRLNAGEYVELTVDQRGINVALKIIGPKDETVMEVDSSTGLKGNESISAIARVSGNYRLEVYSPNKNTVAGRYEVKLVDIRKMTEKDKPRVLALEWRQEAARSIANQSYEDAIVIYDEVLKIWMSLDDNKQKARTLRGLGYTYSLSGQYQKALEYFNQALQFSRASGDRSDELSILFRIGSTYSDLSDSQNGLDYLNQALLLSRETGDSLVELATLSGLSLIYIRRGEYSKSTELLDRSLLLARALGERDFEASILISIGTNYYLRAEILKSLEYLNQALPITREAGNKVGEALALRYIGMAYMVLGDFKKAIDYFDQTLKINQSVGDRSSELFTLRELAVVYSKLGEYSKSIEYYRQALTISRAIGDRFSEASILTNIGLTYFDRDDAMSALDSLNQALPLWRSLSIRVGESRVLSNIAYVYSGLGDKQKSLDYYLQALAISRTAGSRAGEADILSNIGDTYADLGDKEKALRFHTEALSNLRQVGDKAGEGREIISIGEIYNDSGKYKEALEYYSQALKINKLVGDRGNEAITLRNIGTSYSVLGDKERALEYFQQALSINKQTGGSDEALLLYSIAGIERDKGRLSEARSGIESAIEITESLRGKINRPDLRASYSASLQNYYDLYVDVLMRLHKERPSESLDITAFLAAERARARSIVDALASIRADIREGVDTVLLEREDRLRQVLNAKAEAQAGLLIGPHTEQQAAASEKELSDALTEFQIVESQIRRTSPRYAALTQLQRLSLTEIQEMLDKDSLLLEYSLGTERSYLWAVTSDSIRSYELPKSAEIERSAQYVYESLTATGSGMSRRKADAQYQTAAYNLSRMIMGPLSSELKKSRLILITEGILGYVPFAALPDPVSKDKQQPLVINHEIVNLPSAYTLATLRKELAGRKPAAKTLAVLADPVFDASDPRVIKKTGSLTSPGEPATSPANIFQRHHGQSFVRQPDLPTKGSQFSRLPFSAQEARSILAFAPEKEAKLAIGFDANRETATSPELGQYRIIHFATHTFINNQYPSLSGIVLSLVDRQGKPQNGFLFARDIYNLRLPAELVVLSSCQSALGKEIKGKGEGLISLTRGFMYSGTARVMASLWAVDDEATARLMTNFYEDMLGKGLQPSAALRQAQIKIMKQERWESPYYWAAFILQGEWR